jgi:hypothetical protein
MFAVAFLAVVPVGNLLLVSRTQRCECGKQISHAHLLR